MELEAVEESLSCDATWHRPARELGLGGVLRMDILRAAGNAPGTRVLWAKQVAEGATVWKDMLLQKLMEIMSTAVMLKILFRFNATQVNLARESSI